MYDLLKNKVREKGYLFDQYMVLLWAGSYHISLNFETFCLFVILLNKDFKNMFNKNIVPNCLKILDGNCNRNINISYL